MTTFTTEDKEEAYRKKVEEAPYHPGYEDAVVYPTVIVDSGASYEPIPFFGYVDVEKEDLRREVQSLREELARLNNEILRYKIITSKTFIYNPEDDDSVWIIEKL